MQIAMTESGLGLGNPARIGSIGLSYATIGSMLALVHLTFLLIAFSCPVSLIVL